MLIFTGGLEPPVTQHLSKVLEELESVLSGIDAI